MKGKTKKKKLIKGLVIAASFVLTIMLSVGATLAWFYDSDWASNSVTMAGAVGIQLRDSAGKATRGAGALHFKIEGTLAYPGQAMEIQASVFNDGGSSVVNKYGSGTYNDQWQYADGVGTSQNFTDTQVKDSGAGSPCYVRAQFAVLTDIGDTSNPNSVDNQFNGTAIYASLNTLINNYKDSNGDPLDLDYKWVYHRVYEASDSSIKSVYLDSTTGTLKPRTIVNSAGTDVTLTKNGTLDTTSFDFTNLGYFYLCEDDSDKLFEVKVGETSAFLFNSIFIIPWALTNASADKQIYIGVSFEAIQTYVPKVNVATGNKFTIDGSNVDNQLENHYYYADSVQIMFNTSFTDTTNYSHKIRFKDVPRYSSADYNGDIVVGVTPTSAITSAGYSLITGIVPADIKTA